MTFKKRNLTIDIYKSILILLVILGHSIQVVQSNFDDNLLFRIIYSFHMPLFMLVSGKIAFISLRRHPMNLNKKFIGLMIPYFIWSIAPFVIDFRGDLLNLITNILGLFYNPKTGLWFLYVLYLNYCFLKLYLLGNHFKLLLILSNILILVIDPMLFGLLFTNFVYFSYGYLSEKYQIRKKNILICFVIFSLAWHRLEGISLSLIPLKNTLSIQFGVAVLSLYIIVFISWDVFITKISYLLSISKFGTVLSKVGANSIYYYILHFIFLERFVFLSFESVNLEILFVFIKTFLLTIVAVYVFMKIKYIKLLIVLETLNQPVKGRVKV